MASRRSISAANIPVSCSAGSFRARVVKAFNHLDAGVLPEPAMSGGQRTLFYSGRRCGRQG
jgi:hypothetical protein